MRRRGLESSLTVADQPLLTLIYLRQYYTYLQLGEMFSISESYAHKRYTFISKRIMKFNYSKVLVANCQLTGSHEVRGSIPFNSTNQINNLETFLFE